MPDPKSSDEDDHNLLLSPLAPVLVNMFGTETHEGGVMLKMWSGARMGPINAPMVPVPVFTAFMTAGRAIEMANLLNQAATAFKTLAADTAKPQ